MFIIPEFNPLVKPKVNNNVVTYEGRINSLFDALLILEATRLDLLPTINRRLTSVERAKYIVPNTIFVWDETKCGMKRWTDGKLWSPSKVYHGQFLIYKQLVKFNHQRQVDNNGLIKQSFSLVTKQGHRLHLINYFENNLDKSDSASEDSDLDYATNSIENFPSKDPNLNRLVLHSDIYPDNLLLDIPKKNLSTQNLRQLNLLQHQLQTPPSSALNTPPQSEFNLSTNSQKNYVDDAPNYSSTRILKPLTSVRTNPSRSCYNYTDSRILHNLDKVYSL